MDSQVLHDVIIQASKQGIPIFAAAGNSPVTTATYPAAYPEVIAVTATDASGNIASYANRGSFVSMTAPGENYVNFNGLVYDVQGTSTSTAWVSGMAAGLADSSHASSDQESALLKKNVPQSSLLKSLH
jgi:subtilisin family serine protease